MVTRQFIVVAYDIAANRRRGKVAKTLGKYGVRVNYSVFECLLSPADVDRLKDELSAIIKQNKDTVLVYPLCKNCVDNRVSLKGRKEKETLVKVL
jgi:CRISPR-associated protein Cas2